jgi:hypothetical protein
MPRLSLLGRLLAGLALAASFSGEVFPQTDALFTARTQYGRGQYEEAERTLTEAIDAAQAPANTTFRGLLAPAFELRARVRFDLDKTAEAEADFEALLKAFPAHVLSADARTKHKELFESVKTKLVGSVIVRVTPPDAIVTIDGRRGVAGQNAVAFGSRRISVSRDAYTTEERTVEITQGTTDTLTFELERTFAVLRLLVAPEGAEVVVNGTVRGIATTPPPPETVESDSVGLRLVEISNLTRGTYNIIVRKPCYIASSGSLPVDRMADLRLPPIQLKPAVATLSVTSPTPGAAVFLDGAQRGQTPLQINDLCEGPHDVELRAPEGTYSERVIATAGATLSVAGEPKPSIAVVSVTGVPAALRVGADLRQQVSDQLRPNALRLFVPPADTWTKVRTDERLTDSWLAFDQEQRPIGDASAFTPAARLELSRSLTTALRAQAVASIAALDGNPSELALSILAAGSARPDVLRLSTTEPRSTARAADALNARFELFRPNLGMLLIDAADVTGAVVARVEPGGPAAAAGIEAGDIVTAIGGQPLPGTGGVARLLASNARVALAVTNRAGQSRTVNVAPRREPRAASVEDKTFPFNLLLLDLRARLGGLTGLDATIARLNIGIALISLGNWRDARTQLESVSLPNGPGVSFGTVQYLLGLCDEKLNRFPEARAEWQAAARETTALLTEDGPSISELAAEKLKVFAR